MITLIDPIVVPTAAPAEPPAIPTQPEEQPAAQETPCGCKSAAAAHEDCTCKKQGAIAEVLWLILLLMFAFIAVQKPLIGLLFAAGLFLAYYLQ